MNTNLTFAELFKGDSKKFPIDSSVPGMITWKRNNSIFTNETIQTQQNNWEKYILTFNFVLIFP